MAPSTHVSLRRRLAVSPICKSLSEAEVERVFGITEERTYQTGDVLFREGDLSEALMVIAQGRVEVTKQGKLLSTLGTGDVLGELSLFGGTHLRSATGTALAVTTVLRMPTRAFRRMLDAQELAALKIVNTLAHQMAERLLALTDKLVTSTSRAAPVLEARKSLAGWKL